jgi:dTDP-4-dehydrorhamnose reductase
MVKLLLLGSQGQVGQELQPTLSLLGDVIFCDRKHGDLTQPETLRELISILKPDIIVNAAAYTAVDRAESEVELAQTVNAIAPTILAQEAQKLGAKLLHLSTDYVFDGKKNTPYLETDPVNPLGSYGRSKLAGEQGIQEFCTKFVILRTAWVYGAYGKTNFVKTMLRLAQERDTINVVVDQVGSPTGAREIAIAIAQLLETEAQGIYHYTQSGVASWYDFAVAIFEEAQALGLPLCVRQVNPITSDQYPTPAQRPAYSVLSGKKTADQLGSIAPHWRVTLRQVLPSLIATQQR